ERAVIGAVEYHFERVGLDACLLQDVLQPRAAPPRVAHRTDAPFDAGDVRLEEAAAIARALTHRGELRWFEVLAQRVHSELEFALRALAANAESAEREFKLTMDS